MPEKQSKSKKFFYISVSLCSILSVIILSLTYLPTLFPAADIAAVGNTASVVDVKAPMVPSKWKHEYNDTINGPDNYPLVYLRSGYKVVSEKKDKLLIGWEYEFVNTSGTDRDVSVVYGFKDKDNFVIDENENELKLSKRLSYDNIRATFWIDKNDYERIDSSFWKIKMSPGTLTSKGSHRFDIAGAILAKESPYWVSRYTNFLYQTKRDVEYDQKRSPEKKWLRLAKKISFAFDKDTLELLKKSNLWKETSNIPPWSKIKAKSEYVSLTDEQKNLVKEWLQRQEEFDKYDPIKGYNLYAMFAVSAEDEKNDPYSD